MGCEIGIFINSAARHKARNLALANAAVTPFSCSQDITILDSTVRLPNRIIIVGGEGSIRATLQKAYDLHQLNPVGIFGGGTNNLFYNHLKALGNSCSWQDFINGQKELNFFQCRPGMIGNDIFNINLGLGVFEQSQGLINEHLRPFVKGKLRPRLAQVASCVALICQYREGIPSFEMFSTSPRIGAAIAFPKQRIDASTLAHGLILGNSRYESVRNLLVVFLHWQVKSMPPTSAFNTNYGESFETSTRLNTIYLDGDTFTKEKREQVLVRRAPKSIPVIAVV